MPHVDKPKSRRLAPTALTLGLLLFATSEPLTAHAAVQPRDSSGSAPILKVKYATDFTETYSDSGSAAGLHLDVWRPNTSTGWFRLGDVAMDKYKTKPSYALLVQATNDDSAYPELLKPSSFTKVWSDTGSSTSGPGSLWHPVAPTNHGHSYTCLGDIAEKGDTQPNPDDAALKNLRCVRSDWVAEADAQALWNDKGSGADKDGSVYEVRPKNLTQLNAPTFEAEKGYQPGAFENYQALDVRHATFGDKQAPVGEPSGALHDNWTDDDSKSDQVMYKASLGKGSLDYTRYTGIPGWVVRLYCSKAGVGPNPGQCTFHGVGEETRVNSKLTLGNRISDREILNCTSTGNLTDTLSWSYATTDTYTFTQGLQVQFPLGFNITPFGVGFTFETTFTESQQWSWASGSTSTKTSSHAYSAAPGTAAWIAKVSESGEVQAIAYASVNTGINWRYFTSADRALNNGTINNLIDATKSETKANNGYEPVTGAGGESDYIPVAVNMTGDLPELGASNVPRGPGVALIERPLSDAELKTCAGSDWQRVKDARDANYPNLALNKHASATSQDDGHPASAAVDGNSGTYWQSADAGADTPQSLTVDLGKAQKVSRLVLKLPPNLSGRSEDVEVSGSNDERAWTSLLSETVAFEQSAHNTTMLALDPENATWRYLRLTFTNDSGTSDNDQFHAQLGELEAYAS
jgi:hypothetical protein